MRGLAAIGLLNLLAISAVQAQQRSVATGAPSGSFEKGRELLLAGRYVDAAAAFHEHLRTTGTGRFTIRVAVYCDVSHLDAHLRTSSYPPELFLLRRPVGNQLCFGLFWGLFPSRAKANAALSAVPPALRTPGQASAPVSSLLVPGALAAAPPPAPPQVLVPAPPPEAEAAKRPPGAVTTGPPLQGTTTTTIRAVGAAVPRAEIGLGYAYLWDDRMTRIRYREDLTTTVTSDPKLSSNFWAGGLLSANFNVRDRLGIVAEVSGHHQSQIVQGSHVDVDVLGLHAGVRYTDRQDDVATPYVQFLWGMTRFSSKADLPDHTTLSFRPDTNFSIQPGVGVMFRASDHVRIGLGGDYRLVFTGPAADSLLVFPRYKTNEFRLHAGLVFQLGERGGQGTAAAPAELQPLPSGASPQAVGEGATPGAEIGLGYSYLWDDRMSQIRYREDTTSAFAGDPRLSSNFWLGGVLSANFNVTDHLGIVTEVSDHHQSQTVQGVPVDADVLGVHAGVRYTHREDDVATPYAQFLLGMTRFSTEADLPDNTTLLFRPTHFSIQPGVGVMFRLSDKVRFGLGGDYRLVFTEPSTDPLLSLPKYKTNEFRLHAGLVFGVGTR